MRRRSAVLATTLLSCSLLSATVGSAPAMAVTAAGSAPTQVALLVQTGPGSVRTYCVGYRAGMTGAAVLAVASPAYGTGPYTGFVMTIGGSGTTRPTDTTFWAYWRGTAGDGSYVYSSLGVTSTQPEAGSVEAWVYNNGSAPAFPHATYAAICPQGYSTPPATSTAAPAATAAAPAPTPATAAAPNTPRSAGGTSGPPTTTASTGATGPTGATGMAVPVAPTPAGTAGSGATGSNGAASTSATGRSSGALAAAPVAARVSDHTPVGALTGTLVGVIALFGLAGAVLYRRRRHPRED